MSYIITIEPNIFDALILYGRKHPHTWERVNRKKCKNPAKMWEYRTRVFTFVKRYVMKKNVISRYGATDDDIIYVWTKYIKDIQKWIDRLNQKNKP